MRSKKLFHSKPSFLEKKISPNSCFLEEIFSSISSFLEKAHKTQSLPILRGKLNQNLIFLCAKKFSKSPS